MPEDDLGALVDRCHDDLVDLLFATGWVPLDPEQLRVFFARVHRIIAVRMEQANRQIRHAASADRARLMRLLDTAGSN